MSGIHTVAYMTLIHGMYPSNIIQLKYISLYGHNPFTATKTRIQHIAYCWPTCFHLSMSPTKQNTGLSFRMENLKNFSSYVYTRP